MSLEYKKKSVLESVDSMRIFVPGQFGAKEKLDTLKSGFLEQWPVVNGRPVVAVGIMTCGEVTIDFVGTYRDERDALLIQSDSITYRACDIDSEVNIVAVSPNASFSIGNVTIGIGFHWERDERQSFSGDVCLKRDGNLMVVINRLDVEEYLKSVISSEMSADAGIELLKAHAVISRSWLLRGGASEHSEVCQGASDRIVKWYERDAHRLFDVCADDHCQRYQGLHRQRNGNVNRAVEATSGMVLTYDGEICDARFSKCCGGRTERFSTAWADVDYHYLQPVSCPYCDTHDASVLRQVLNDYDTETVHFHDWEVRYSAGEISELICRRSGIDFGGILDLVPIRRGESGRIYELKVVGTKRTLTVGKELEIRKWLSGSHLYSSAFDVVREGTDFVLRGHGWGHGVGLCQIGAAVMAERGYRYDEILSHYYTDSELQKIY